MLAHAPDKSYSQKSIQNNPKSKAATQKPKTKSHDSTEQLLYVSWEALKDTSLVKNGLFVKKAVFLKKRVIAN